MDNRLRESNSATEHTEKRTTVKREASRWQRKDFPGKIEKEKMVGSRRIELRTRGFSGLCSTD